MKDILQDIVSHTHSLGFLDLVRVVTDDQTTNITSVTDDRNVVLLGTAHDRVPDFKGAFGMGNLSVLNLLLKNPEYKEDPKLEIILKTKKEDTYPAALRFENLLGDFQNEYRFTSDEIVESKIGNPKFKGATWDINFEPPVSSITRMKLMSAVHSEENKFLVYTENGNLIFSFGDESSHSGQFVFKHNVETSLKTKAYYPINEMQSILSLSGNTSMSISDLGAIRVAMDSGLANYEYIFPCLTK